MKTTARNQFVGTITQIETGQVTTEVTLTLRSGSEITAALTSGAAKSMKLKKGREALALIKASAIVLVTDFGGYTLSARNQLAGTVSRVEKGAVSSMIGVTLPGGEVVTATVTNDAVSALGPQGGSGRDGGVQGVFGDAGGASIPVARMQSGTPDCIRATDHAAASGLPSAADGPRRWPAPRGSSRARSGCLRPRCSRCGARLPSWMQACQATTPSVRLKIDVVGTSGAVRRRAISASSSIGFCPLTSR